MHDKEKRPLVGMGVMVFKDGKILLCKRKSPMGEGEYAFPGGHVEHMEALAECARRETREECGIEIDNIKFLGLFNLNMFAPKHYVGIGFTADWESGEPQVLEPDKCVDWSWHDINDLPHPMFKPTWLMIDAHLKGYNFHDF